MNFDLSSLKNEAWPDCKLTHEDFKPCMPQLILCWAEVLHRHENGPLCIVPVDYPASIQGSLGHASYLGKLSFFKIKNKKTAFEYGFTCSIYKPQPFLLLLNDVTHAY